MRGSLNRQILYWLALVSLPVVAAGLWAAYRADARLAEQARDTIANTARLEAIDIDNRLDDYEREATGIAGGFYVRTFTSQLVGVRAGRVTADTTIGGYNGFQLVDGAAEQPLDELATVVHNRARGAGVGIRSLAIVDVEGTVLGHTPEPPKPIDDDLLRRAITDLEPQFGRVFVASETIDGTGSDAGNGREEAVVLAVVAPITNGNTVVGAVLIEADLQPLVDSVASHQQFGATHEAFLLQSTATGSTASGSTANGSIELITPRRFDSIDPFTPLPENDPTLRSALSLDTAGGEVLTAASYRGTTAIVAVRTIERTGWGLVVQVDRDEVLGPVAEARNLIVASSLGASIVILAGWWLILAPTIRRLRRAANAAERIADGHLDERLNDGGDDEIHALANSIDRLASELQLDIARRAEAESDLVHQATHDMLTGLANRQTAAELLEEELATASPAVPVSVLFIDLDRFKAVNDTLGHRAGDQLLKGIADRLFAAVEGGLVARWGGDEFLVVLPGAERAEAEAVSKLIAAALRDPVRADGHEVVVSASVGVSSADSPISVDALVKRADHRMFEAKGDRRRRTHGRRPSLRSLGRSALSVPSRAAPATSPEDDLEDGLAHRLTASALSDDRLDVWYQPIFNVDSAEHATPVGAEALVRLRLADGSILPPAGFLPRIDGSDLGRRLDERVITKAVADLERWQATAAVDERFQLSLNISCASTSNVHFASFLGDRLRRHRIDPARIVIELPETADAIDPGVIARIREQGVALAIDDFGLSRSNLDRAEDFRAEIVKLDRRWMGSPDRPIEPRELEILSSLVRLCRSMNVHVVAEGIETVDQLETLLSLGVSDIQGYFLSKPLPGDQFALLLDRYRELEPATSADPTEP